MIDHRVRRKVLAGLAVLLLVQAYTVAQSYHGRVQIESSLLAGCARGEADRSEAAKAAEASAKANAIIATDPFQSRKTRQARAAQEVAALAAAVGYRSRLALCPLYFPAPTLAPW